MFDEQAKMEQQWCIKQFATHKAKLIQDTDRYFIADWRKADGGGDYYINFILDKKRGSLIISGDLGDCIATWYNELTPAKLCGCIRHDIGYFIRKFQASSDRYVYDEDDILNDIKKHFEEEKIEIEPCDDGFDAYADEDEFWDTVESAIYESYETQTSFIASDRLTHLIKKYDSDCYQWLNSCGKRISARIYMWAYALDEMLKQLGYIESEEK